MQLLPCPFCGTKTPLFNIASLPPGPIVSKPGWYVRCRSAKCSARLDAGTAPHRHETLEHPPNRRSGYPMAAPAAHCPPGPPGPPGHDAMTP